MTDNEYKTNRFTGNNSSPYFPCLYLSFETREEADSRSCALGLPDESIKNSQDGCLVPIQWKHFRDYAMQHLPWYDEEGWQRAFLMFMVHHPILHSLDEIIGRYNIDRKQCSFRRPAPDEPCNQPFRAEILEYSSGAALNIQSGSTVVEVSLEKTKNGDYRPKGLDGSFASFFSFESDLRTLWAVKGFNSTREAIRQLMSIMEESDWMPISGTVTWREGDEIMFQLK